MIDLPGLEGPLSEAKKYDEELIKICGDLAMANVDRIFRHLRDAREAERNADEPMFARIAVILAAASLESNLSHLTARALAIADARPALYSREQLEYLRGVKKVVTDRGYLKEVPIKQSLEERLQLVPDLLARAFDRHYVLPARSTAIRKLHRTIELRDAIIHPRWIVMCPLSQQVKPRKPLMLSNSTSNPYRANCIPIWWLHACPDDNSGLGQGRCRSGSPHRWQARSEERIQGDFG